MVCLFGALFSLVASGNLVVCKNNTRVLGIRNINQKRSRKTSEFCFLFVRTHDIIVWYIITNTRWFHCSTWIVCMWHEVQSVQQQRCVVTAAHAHDATYKREGAQACVHKMPRASSQEDTMPRASERARTHAKSECARGHCQEWVPRHTMSKRASTQCHHKCDVVHDTTQPPTPASQFNFSYDIRG